MNRPTGAIAALVSAVAFFGISAGDATAQKIRKHSIADKFLVSFDKSYKPGSIVVSFTDRRLYHITASGRAMSYPIAVPRPQSRWEGTNRVTLKKKNPTWTPTASMRRENPALPVRVAGGDPSNPLGKRALYLGSTLYRIHGTDAPWTIGRNVSKGCIRMHNPHVAELFRKVKIGARVTATYKSFRVAAIGPYKPTYVAERQRPRRRTVRLVRRDGSVIRIPRPAKRKPEPKLLDWLLGS